MRFADKIKRLFSFSEPVTPQAKAALQTEMFTGIDGFDPVGWMGLFPDPDPVLLKTGDGVSVLRALLGDWKVISSIQSRKLGTLKKRDYVLEAGHAEGKSPEAESVRVCKDLDEDLKTIDIYNLFSQVLDAPYFGSTFVEVIWRPEAGRMRIEALNPRPVEWFGFDSKHEPRYRGTGELMEAVPYGKLVIARHFPDATNPYGLRLLSRCLWPVAIKKGGVRFWTTFCERFGMPWVVGKAPTGSSKEDRSEILSSLALMVQDAVAVVSGGTEVDIHGVDSKGGDLHPSLIEYMDKAIAMVLMGQTLTADIGDVGSKAASQTHAETLNDYREADETLIVMFMQQLGDLYAEINSPTAASPTFRFREPEDYGAQADLDGKLYKVGVKFQPVHFVRRYNLAEDEFSIDASDAENADDEKTETTNLAAGGEPEAQAGVEALVDAVMKEAGDAFAGNEALILKAVTSSESYEEAFSRLLDLHPSLTIDTLEDALSRALVNGKSYGRWTAKG
jgi:phage gp29-like protein